eukprot:CAMPEP_0181492904 /NCGR_PEP_ID=MMETSP1110-20121109/50938_1 /TAXON_ID=174948 /ORGANISM="Symbiodinium sp., Strain CCMP421" /LENGTH=72 /DNA_ID=CAMNT_0023620183 /DNA_START=267 /DNA_END=486 /DNA_ORIENTATION=+
MTATCAVPLAKASQKRLSSEYGHHIHPKADVGSCRGVPPLHSSDALMLNESFGLDQRTLNGAAHGLGDMDET